MKPQDVNPASHESLNVYRDPPVVRPEHAEGVLARLLEQQTAKVPSDLFLMAALAAMGGSLLLELRGHWRASQFVGMWPAPLLVMGLYNKLVKVFGSH